MIIKGKTKKAPPPNPHPTSLLMNGDAYFLTRQNDDLFFRGLKASAGTHAALIIAAIIGGLIFAREPMKVIPSIRVDLVGLPDIKKADLNKVMPDDLSDLSKKLNEGKKDSKKLSELLKKTPEPKPVVEPKDDSMAMKKEKPKGSSRKDELKSAIERMKALSDIESDVRKTKKVVAKGNSLSKGNSLTGAPAVDINAFAARVQTKVRDNWDLPAWLANQKLAAQVTIYLDRAGYVGNVLVSKSSGNKQFDEYAVKSIRMAQPFGPPPAEAIDDGITLAFPL